MSGGRELAQSDLHQAVWERLEHRQLRPCRNTAKRFMDSDKGSRTQSQCLVMPEELKQPENPPECTDGLVQFFELVDPDFAFFVCWWRWPRSRGVSMPAEGALPELLRLLGPCPSFSSTLGSLLGWECSGGQAALTAPGLGWTGSQPWCPDEGITPCCSHCHLLGYSKAWIFFPRAQLPFKHLQRRVKFPEVLIRQLPPLGHLIID